MKSKEFKKIYHPSLGRYVYEHRGNGLIVDNIMKPLKAALSTAASTAGRAIAKKLGKKAKATKVTAGTAGTAGTAEKSGDLIRKRLSQGTKPKRGRASAKAQTKMSKNEVNALINNLIARS